ncbi:tryptophan-rich sensory protein [Thermobifida halotolerans]|uniref:Tryptophan-rich sensory protein n=1 Tax=Thermobifida halotolerans TaxID=483545 RepID=A0A399G1B5_9ACTN|nr:TspO/MBR family protein [Thermobifida halotolerans]UOE17864.1 tryptophan-rich sensory protein [Thermobifida halotolerans]
MSVTTRSTPYRALAAGAAFAAAVLATAVVGGLASAGSASVYTELDLPVWAPPSWLFTPVWTVLYVLIAVSGWLVWRASGWRGAAAALTVYAVQLVLNALWPVLFFGAGQYGPAFAEIVLLWVSIVAVVALFRRHSVTASLLLLPYLAWVTYAGALNLAIWTAN